MDDLTTDDEKQAAIKAYLESNQSSAVADNSPPANYAPTDESVDDAQPADPVSVASIAPQDAAPASSPEIDKEQAIKDKLQKEYAAANDFSGIKAAQEDAKRANFSSNLGDALETMAKANSMAHGGAGVDTGFYQGLKQQGQQGVTAAIGAKDAKIQQFLKQNDISRQVAQDMMEKGDYEQKQKASQYLNDTQTPTSQVSKNAQLAFQNTFKDYPEVAHMDVSQFSAADLDKASKNVDVVAKLQELKQSKQMQLAYQNSTLSNKKDKDQEHLYSEMNNKIATPRGNTAVQQAQVGVSSGSKAMDLINRYPNLDDMPSQQVALLAQEISKVASGGVGSEHGQRSIEANTLQSAWNKLTSSIDGQPTGAQLKGFIEQNKNYLEDMTKTNQQTINDYGRQVYNGYKKRLTPDQDIQFRSDNPHIFEEEKAASNGAPAAPSSSPASPALKVQTAAVHPQAGDAEAWAKANPKDPRSAVILQRLGAMNAGL